MVHKIIQPRKRVIAAPIPVDHRVMFFCDPHLDSTMEPTPAYNVAMQFARDVKPEVGIMGGDWLDLSYLSKFTKNTPLLTENRRYQKDMLLSVRQLENWRKNFDAMYFMPGNHDERVTRYVESVPMLEGKFDIRKDYGIDDLAIGWSEYNAVLSHGKMNFTHGWYWNQYHARKHLNDMGDHIFYGHVHDHQVHCKPVRARRLPFIAMSMGCLCCLNPYWKRNRPTEWVAGIGFFEVAASGNFTPLFLPIIDGELSYAGFTWKA